jgi:hypothetical protein
VLTREGLYVADLLEKRLWCCKGDESQELMVTSGLPTIAAQYAHFAEVIRGHAKPLVSAATAFKTLETAWAIQGFKATLS